MEKVITIMVRDDNSLNVATENFSSDFEINGILQTLLVYRVMNHFTGDNGNLPQATDSTEPAQAE